MPYLTEDQIPEAARKIGKTADCDAPEFQRIVEIMRAMLLGAGQDARGGAAMMTANHVNLTIAACGLMAGYLTGGSIAAGALDDTDEVADGIREIVGMNFIQGLQLGKDAVALELVEQQGATKQ